ncbi:MAG: TetR/AcrR family transcriptional regulator [Ilumatobacteraceae bacterium]|nr:TetR/AcrR family transcriptional regulator [Ilumatobacteraceae bacterium]
MVKKAPAPAKKVDKRRTPGRTDKNVVNVDGRDRRPWALASKERLLTAATEEIAAVGFERARLAEIADRAEMTPGSVYTWFANKEDLFRAALEEAFDAQLLSNVRALEKLPADSAPWLIKIAALIPRNSDDDDFTNAQKLLVETYYASWRDPLARDVLAPRVREHFALYIKIIDDAKDEGEIDASLDTQMLASLFLGLAMGLALIGMAGIGQTEPINWFNIGVLADQVMRPI